MIEMQLEGVRVELPTNQPIVLLRERDGERYLPIWIGAAEAAAALVEGTVLAAYRFDRYRSVDPEDPPPPALEPSDERHAGRDRRYSGLDPKEIPLTECLKDTVERVVPFWNERIAPRVARGERVLVAAHGG